MPDPGNAPRTARAAPDDDDSDGSAGTPTSARPASLGGPRPASKRASGPADFGALPPSSLREDVSEASGTSAGGEDADGGGDGDGGGDALGLVVAPPLPWVAVRIRYLGRPVVVTCLARAYVATLTFSATLDAVRFCAAGFLGPERAYGVLEYAHGRWRQPMALRVVLRQERVAVARGPRAGTSRARSDDGASEVGDGDSDGTRESGGSRGGGREVHRETFVASCYPEEGWKYLADSLESLELIVDPNFD
ncbi:hypothetical protein PsYK624_034130 [Phanerochaete sordida]|uniref:Uncharacterized protein n=1 Tax=Phanerochaete sordida TaxID=48140 RepID=A0A9P3G496_9APHY|nr:hypothetical protein PsYK624_034130 [Phanerochaete sordida]